MATVTTGHSFSSGDALTATKLNTAVGSASVDTIVNADIDGSAAIDLSKLDKEDAMDAASYQVDSTTVIDGSRNLTNIAAITTSGTITVGGSIAGSPGCALGATNIAGNTSITGAFTVEPGFTVTSLHAAVTNLGENSGDTINLNGTVAGSPTLTAATADFTADSLVGMDGSTTNGPLKAFPLTDFTSQFANQVAIYQEQQSSGTVGGTATATTWTKRAGLTTEVSDLNSLASVAAGVITIGTAGTYHIKANATFFQVGTCSIRVRKTNATAATVALGVSASTDNGGTYAAVSASAEGVYVLSASDTLELQYYVGVTSGTSDLGNPVTSGEQEVYSNLTLTKIA